jgi:hypothetical protein
VVVVVVVVVVVIYCCQRKIEGLCSHILYQYKLVRAGVH